MNEKQAKGKTFLLVTGIILIVLGVFSILGVVSTAVMLNSMNSGDASTTTLLEQTLKDANLTVDMMRDSAVFSAITAVLYLLSGILGIVFRKKPGKANICLLLAALMILLVMASAVYTLMVMKQFTVWSVALNLVLPLLYLWGAIQNKQS